MKTVESENFIVRIHGEVNKEKLLNACKIYCQKVEIKKGEKTNEKNN